MNKIFVISLFISLGLILSGCDQSSVVGDHKDSVNQTDKDVEDNEVMDVKVEFKNKVKDGNLMVKGDTNLPRSTIVTITVSSDNGLIIEEEVEIGMMGGFKVKDISDNGNPLQPGKYMVNLTMSPTKQKEDILKKIGSKGELLAGDFVIKDENYNIVSAEDTVTIEEDDIKSSKNGNDEKQSPLDKIKEKDYITSLELDDDGTVNAIIDGKSPISVNFTFDKAVDILEDMKLAFEDEQVTGYYAMVMIDVIDSKGNEREEEGFNLYYSREDFEALNYDNFYNLSYSEPYRIFNESTSYLINPVMYKDLKDDYKNNLTYEHNKPNYVTE
jgi:hypothetical protein